MPDVSAEPTAPSGETVSATPVAVSVGVSSRPHAGPIDDAERDSRKAALEDLMDLMRPAIQADGGDIIILDVDFDEGVVEVQLQGACGSCAIASVTLQGGVERILKERLPWVSEVRGGVDESMDPFESASMGRGAYVPRWE
jgi:Fe-S cluster biogenesis protein NfuA